MSNFIFKQHQLVICLPYLPRKMRSPTKAKAEKLLAHQKPGKGLLENNGRKPWTKSTFSPAGIRKPLGDFSLMTQQVIIFQHRSHPYSENTKFSLRYEENMPALSSHPCREEHNIPKGSDCDRRTPPRSWWHQRHCIPEGLLMALAKGMASDGLVKGTS